MSPALLVLAAAALGEALVGVLILAFPREVALVLVDAARQQADMAQVAGVGPISGATLAEVLAAKCRAVDALVPGPAGTLLLANRWAPKASPDYSRSAQQRLLAELQSLGEETDVLVVDIGSGHTAILFR